MCPVDPVCHRLTCHRRLFSLSRTRYQHFIALFTPIHFAISATPNSQRRLFTYGMRDVIVKVCEVREFGLCGCVSQISLHV